MTGTVTVTRLASRRRCRHHFATIVMAASGADMMRTLHLAAIRAFDVARRLQMVVGAAHVATRLRGLLFRYCHGCHSGLAPDSGARCRSIAKKAGGGKLLGWAATGAGPKDLANTSPLFRSSRRGRGHIGLMARAPADKGPSPATVVALPLRQYRCGRRRAALPARPRDRGLPRRRHRRQRAG